VLGCAPAGTADASGTYQVSACNRAPHGENNSWTWATNDLSHYSSHATCPYPVTGGREADQEGGLSTTDALGLSSGATPGTEAGWKFVAPAGTSIVALSYERNIGHSFDGFNDWSPALRADGNVVSGETCLDSVENGETCAVGGPPGIEPAQITGLSAHELSLGILCQAPAGDECVTGASEHQTWATTYGAIVTLSDPSPPILSAPVGALWTLSAAGFHKGTENVEVSAQDIGGGVASIVLSADGQPIDTYTAPCDFSFAQPCPLATRPQTLSLPTTELGDGKHTIALSAVDAAGNPSMLASEEITVDNNAPAAPVGLSAAPTQTGGATFVVTWGDPPSQAAPITSALYEVCPAAGQSPCSTPMTAPANGPASITVPGVGSWTIAVWLSDAAGNASPSSAARTNVVVPAKSEGQGTKPGGTTPTKRKVHVTETLRARTLIAHVTGPASGKVRVGVIAKLKGRVVFFSSKTFALNRGRLTVMLKLEPKTAAHASIRVSARFDHEATVTSTLSRHRRRRSA
jgi:hypothetical protein